MQIVDLLHRSFAKTGRQFVDGVNGHVTGDLLDRLFDDEGSATGSLMSPHVNAAFATDTGDLVVSLDSPGGRL